LSLANLKQPRHILWDDLAIKELTPFAGTEYFVSVFQDSESANLANELTDMLKGCGWVYKLPPSVDTVITLRSGMPAPVNLEIGVRALFNTNKQSDAWSALATIFCRARIWSYAFAGGTKVAPAGTPMHIIIGQKSPNTFEVACPAMPRKK